MAEVGSAYLTIIPTSKGFASNLQKEIGGGLDTAGTEGGKAYSKGMLGGAKSGLSGAGKVLGGILLAGAGAAIVGIGAIIHTGFGEMMDASAGTAQLAAGIKSTGNAANVSVTGLNNLASSIQAYSGQTDDSIVAAEQLLLTFTNIKNVGPDKIFDQATVAAADMAAKMGGDASGNAILLGKALNDPVKGITALTRVGVSFSQGQKDAIAAMVKTGDTAGAQKLILKELNVEFGGAAKAAGDSLPGQLAKGKRSFEDLSQTLVTGAMPAISAVSDKVTTVVIPALKDFATEFENGTGAGGRLKDGLAALGGVLGTVGATVLGVAGWLKDHNTVVISAAVVVGVLTVAVQAHNLALAISTGSLKAWILQTTIVKTALAVWTAGQWLLTAAMNANPIGLVITAIGLLVAGIVLIATKTTWFQTIWKVMTDALGTAWQWMWNSILAPVIRFVLNGFASIVDGIAKMLSILSNIPGFGWAKAAADKMEGAADKARALANGIKDIPDKVVTVTVNWVENGRTVGGSTGPSARAMGGPVTAGQPYIVGEHRPELFIPNVSGTIIPRVPATSQASGAGSPDLLAEVQGLRADIRALPRAYQLGQRQYA